MEVSSQRALQLETEMNSPNVWIMSAYEKEARKEMIEDLWSMCQDNAVDYGHGVKQRLAARAGTERVLST